MLTPIENHYNMKIIGTMATRGDSHGTHGCLITLSKYTIFLFFLVVNIDQIGVHLMPMGVDRTWEIQGAKHIQVFGIEDKRQIINIVSSLVNGNCCLYKLCST